MRQLARLLAVAVLLIGTVPAFAQSSSADRAAYEAAFQETLNKPGDPAANVRFAELAIQAGDYHGAIAALERLHLIDPQQPQVNMQLATLYMRLGAYATAQIYLSAVIASPRSTAETRGQAHTMLEQIDKRIVVSKFSGEMLFGLQYSSNANSGGTGTFQSGGSPVVATPDISRTPDWAAVSGAVLHHRYDLRSADRGVVESDLAIYATRQFTVSQANIFLIDLTSGPRFDLLAETVDGLTARPFATGRYVSVHDQPTYWAYGTGLELAKEFAPTMRGTLTALGRRRDFQNNADSSVNTNSSGNEMLGVLGLDTQLASWLTLRLSANTTRYIASVQSESYAEFGGGFSAIFGFDDPLGFTGLPWSVTVGGRILLGNYDGPDPNVDPVVVRVQRDLVASLVAAIPLDERLTLVGQVTYTDRAASLSNYAYNSTTTLVGIGWRF